VPIIQVYVSEKLYKELYAAAMKEGLTVPKTMSRICEIYFGLREERKMGEWQEENTGLSTKAT